MTAKTGISDEVYAMRKIIGSEDADVLPTFNVPTIPHRRVIAAIHKKDGKSFFTFSNSTFPIP
jgi:hypothetical protein